VVGTEELEARRQPQPRGRKLGLGGCRLVEAARSKLKHLRATEGRTRRLWLFLSQGRGDGGLDIIPVQPGGDDFSFGINQHDQRK
jgi:hypothetical protein